jgi:hypothetical protein
LIVGLSRICCQISKKINLWKKQSSIVQIEILINKRIVG